MQACLRFSCSASFIGSGSIWPEPEVETMTLKDSGLAAVKPASASSFFPFSGSNVYLLTGLPKAGSVGFNQPTEGSAVPCSSETSAPRSMQ